MVCYTTHELILLMYIPKTKDIFINYHFIMSIINIATFVLILLIIILVIILLIIVIIIITIIIIINGESGTKVGAGGWSVNAHLPLTLVRLADVHDHDDDDDDGNDE